MKPQGGLWHFHTYVGAIMGRGEKYGEAPSPSADLLFLVVMSVFIIVMFFFTYASYLL